MSFFDDETVDAPMIGEDASAEATPMAAEETSGDTEPTDTPVEAETPSEEPAM